MVLSTVVKLDIAALCNELSSISDWFTLGLNLGVQYHQLDQIRRNYSVEGCSGCRREAIVLWLRHIPTASWRDVVHALEKMEENTVAEVIRAKYIVASKLHSINKSGVTCNHFYPKAVTHLYINVFLCRPTYFPRCTHFFNH